VFAGGDGMQPGVAMGAIQHRMQFDKVSRLVDEARAEGATIVCGGLIACGDHRLPKPTPGIHSKISAQVITGADPLYHGVQDTVETGATLSMRTRAHGASSWQQKTQTEPGQ
jgi:hypothetical protein